MLLLRDACIIRDAVFVPVPCRSRFRLPLFYSFGYDWPLPGERIAGRPYPRGVRAAVNEDEGKPSLIVAFGPARRIRAGNKRR